MIGKVDHYSIKSGSKTVGILTLSPRWELLQNNGKFDIVSRAPEQKPKEELEQEVQIVNEVQVAKIISKETKKEAKCTCGVIDDYYANTFNCRIHGKGVRIDVRAPTYAPPSPPESTNEGETNVTIDCKMKVWKWLKDQSDDE